MLRRFFTRQVLAHGIAMLLVVAVLIAARGQTVSAQPTWDSGLLVNTRSSLRACMVTAPSLQGKASTLAARLSRGFQHARQHKDWEGAGLGKAVPAIEAACTGAKFPTQLLEKGALVGPGVTKNPTPFRTVIFVLDNATADRVLGSDKHAGLYPYELMTVNEHEFVEVTSGLVVRESFLDSPEFVDPYLTLALGLEPSKPFARPEGATGM